jgi:hypothetical protein
MSALRSAFAIAFPLSAVAWRFVGVVRAEEPFLPAAGRARRFS